MATPTRADLDALASICKVADNATNTMHTFAGLAFALLALRSSKATAQLKALALSPWLCKLPLHRAPAEVGSALAALQDRMAIAMIFASWCATVEAPGCRISSPAVAEAWRQAVTHRSTCHIVYRHLSPTLWPCALAVQGGRERYTALIRQTARMRRQWACDRPVRDGASHMVARAAGRYESSHFGLGATWMDAVIFSAVFEDNLTVEMVSDLQLAAQCYKWESTKVAVANLLLRKAWRQPRPGMQSTSRVWLAAAAYAAIFSGPRIAYRSTLQAECGYFTTGALRQSTLLAEMTRIDSSEQVVHPPPAATERAMRFMAAAPALHGSLFPIMRVCLDRFAVARREFGIPNELIELIISFVSPPPPRLWADYVLK